MTVSGYLIGCAISLLIHELGHICTAQALGVRVKKVGIALRGPYIVRDTGTPAANAVISAAGPSINLLLAAATWQQWPTLALISLVLGLANLFPMPGADGRRVLDSLALVRRENSVPAHRRPRK